MMSSERAKSSPRRRGCMSFADKWLSRHYDFGIDPRLTGKVCSLLTKVNPRRRHAARRRGSDTLRGGSFLAYRRSRMSPGFRACGFAAALVVMLTGANLAPHRHANLPQDSLG